MTDSWPGAQELTRRVAAGVARLDREAAAGRLAADWPCQIDLRSLDLSSYRHCVLAQLYDGGYYRAAHVLRLDWALTHKLGFDAHDYEALTGTWIQVLPRLQAERCGRRLSLAERLP